MHSSRCVPPAAVAISGGFPHPPWTETLTHATENITLPQTSFAGSNNIFSKHNRSYNN